ncbi:hypothetical protein EVAR_22016_1 [Eumeta japonica]|uniref:Uncharacterized protein n=1 Tax=Eumeta variegata TaxID=151549 RepID=A0A4C1YYS2_EUMVA|nr:hypothetical protein EVAR_22016_1 [Eumeta japonica]
MFDLPDDPEQSEDKLDSDDDNSTTVCPTRPSSPIIRPPSQLISDSITDTESNTDQSDNDEDAWKKVMWTNRPKSETFDEKPLQPKRRVTNRTRYSAQAQSRHAAPNKRYAEQEIEAAEG